MSANQNEFRKEIEKSVEYNRSMYLKQAKEKMPLLVLTIKDLIRGRVADSDTLEVPVKIIVDKHVFSEHEQKALRWLMCFEEPKDIVTKEIGAASISVSVNRKDIYNEIIMFHIQW